MLLPLDLPQPPSAVFCCNDLTALGALTALRERGVAVPSGCSVLGYDDIDMALHTVPPLTTIRVDKELLGAEGVRLLTERIARPATPMRHVQLEVTLVERLSVQAFSQDSATQPSRPQARGTASDEGALKTRLGDEASSG